MKNRIMILAMAAVTLLFAGCQKEDVFSNGQLKLKAEGYGFNTKVAVDGGSSVWVTGDSVLINGDTALVQVSGSEARVSGLNPITSPFYGVYPARICSEYGSNCTLNIPAQYTYVVSDGKQILRSPMVAYASSGNELYFKHVTAAIGVQVKNYHDYAVVVDSIEVISNSYQLSGTVTVDMGATPTVNTKDTPTTAEKSVKMKCNVTVAASSSATVQVPVLPVGDENKFTVNLWAHKASEASVAIELNRTQGTTHSLARAEIGYAMYTLGGPFTVNGSGKKVVFSEGNLQYNAYTTTWRFAEHQYDYMGSYNANIADDYNGWIDLFGWGTGNAPTTHTTNVTDYSSFNDWGTAASSDIGSGWYTLTKDEWGWLVGPSTGTITPGTNCRETMTFGLTGTDNDKARFVLAMVGDVNGMIVFPDNYCHPSNVTVSYNNAVYNGKVSFNKFCVTEENWSKMQLAGAAFLPASGWRYDNNVNDINSYGLYWSKTNYNTNYSYTMYFTNNSFNPTKNYSASGRYDTYLYSGQSVRLVRDVE